MDQDLYPTNMSKSKKFLHCYSAKDIASILDELIQQIQTPDGNKFQSSHVMDNTVYLKVGPQTFIINISEKNSLS
jgi:hypothetical protein